MGSLNEHVAQNSLKIDFNLGMDDLTLNRRIANNSNIIDFFTRLNYIDNHQIKKFRTY